MTRTVALLLVVAACGSCMKMRETVERMVMVRQTGSDLHPAATGYIYKKESDGPASVQHMEEGEIMEHLNKFYEQPKAFAAPIPVAAGPFYAKEEKEDKVVPQSSEEHIIPVVEKSEEDTDKEDGIADEVYSKIFNNYDEAYAKHKNNLEEYLKSLGHFKGGIYHEHGGGKEHGTDEHHAQGDKGYKDYKNSHHFEKGNAGNYNTEKYESFAVSTGSGYKKDYDDADAYGKHYEQGHGFKGGDHGHKAAHSKGEETDGFHKLYDKDEAHKDHDFYDGGKYEGGFHKYGDGHKYHGSDAGGHKKGGSHESGHDEAGYGKSGNHEHQSSEDKREAHSEEAGGESSYGKHGDFSSKHEHDDGKSYGYIKH